MCNYCMIILSSMTRTILILSSNPELHLHSENGLQALNDLTNIMWPCWRHSPRRWIRARKCRDCWDIFLLNCSFSQREAMDSPTSAKTLPLFYSEPYIQVSVYPHHETDRWQLHRHGTREGRRTAWKAIWQQERAGMSDCEGFGMGPKLQSCIGKRPQSRKQVCAVEGEVGELQEAPELTEDRHTLRVGVVSVWMWGWNVYWLQCNVSHDGCVHLLSTAQYK